MGGRRAGSSQGLRRRASSIALADRTRADRRLDPSTDDSPGLLCKPRKIGPRDILKSRPGLRERKNPRTAPKKKGWSLFGWLKKKEKPTKAASPASAAPPQFGSAPPAKPSWQAAESPPALPESMSFEEPEAEFEPNFSADEPEGSHDLPDENLSPSNDAEFEPELEFDSPETAESPSEEIEPQSGEPDLGETILAEDGLDPGRAGAFWPVRIPPAADFEESSDEIRGGATSPWSSRMGIGA